MGRKEKESEIRNEKRKREKTEFSLQQ